jgi:hypothetical protein
MPASSILENYFKVVRQTGILPYKTYIGEGIDAKVGLQPVLLF